MTPDERIQRLTRLMHAAYPGDDRPVTTVEYWETSTVVKVWGWRVEAPTLDEALTKVERMIVETTTVSIVDRRESLDQAMKRHAEVERILSST